MASQAQLYNPWQTGGNQPAVQATPQNGSQPPVPPIPQNGGQPLVPPVTQPIAVNGAQPLVPPTSVSGATPSVPQQPQLLGGFSPANVATDTMNQIIDSNGAYLGNARRRGIEQAARNGMRAGSSIAGGAAERSALEAAAPIFSAAMGMQGDREQRAFAGEQSALNRSQELTRDQYQGQIQDWLSSNQFNREFNGALSMMPINSAYQMNNAIMQYALESPDVYTQTVISGMSNFFNQNMLQILSTYFPNYNQGGNTAGANP